MKQFDAWPPEAKWMLIAQLGILLLLVFAVVFVFNQQLALAVGLGGLVLILPNLLFTMRAFQHRGARAAKKIVRDFYRAEKLKLVLVAIGFGVIFSTTSLPALPVLLGFAAVLSTQAWVPILYSLVKARRVL